MNVDEFPDPHSPITDLKARDRWQAIVELLDVLVESGKISPRNRPEIESAVKRREMALSTAVGSGIGLPHASTNLVKEPVAAFGRSKPGINFEAPDRKPVYKVCLFLTPAGQFQKHLHVLANISKMMQKSTF